MDFSDFQQIIKRRSEINDEWYTEVEKCWGEMITLFSRDVAKTVQFLNVCTADEFSWLSEVFEGIAEKTCCPDFITALYRTAEKYPEEVKQFNLLSFIQSAEDIVKYCSGDSVGRSCQK